MKKIHAALDEIWIWLRGRFSLTGEERFWLLLFLIVVWAGLLGRYLYLKHQSPDRLSTQQVEALFSGED